MNNLLMWAVPLALVLALLGWAVLRRRVRKGRQTVAPRTVAPASVAATAAAESSGVAAQHQAAIEALRHARRRKAEDETRRAADPIARLPARAPVVPPTTAAGSARPRTAAPATVTPIAQPPARPLAPADAAPDPVVPVLSPLAIQLNSQHTATPPPAGLAPLRPPARPAGPPTVLVVDDSKVVRIKTGRLMEKQGWRVLLADDGQAALACLASDSPDLLITDVEMPGLDGFGLTRQLRAHPRWARLPVIMITSSDDKHRADAAAAGVDVLLGKPYAEDALLAQAQALLGRAARRGASALH